jgi:putative NADH-flavin reductase
MKLLIFGATGPTGREIVAQALEQMHDVTVFARKPESLPAGVRAVQGDAMREPQAIAEALQGQDAVVSALGTGKVLLPNRLQERSLGNIVPAMERAGVKRFVVMSAFGVGDTLRDASLVQRLIYATLLSAVFADKARGEATVRASALDWTIVYPTVLTNGPRTGGPRTGQYRTGERIEAIHGLPTISRADVAQFMLAELARRAYVRRGVAITY